MISTTLGQSIGQLTLQSRCTFPVYYRAVPPCPRGETCDPIPYSHLSSTTNLPYAIHGGIGIDVQISKVLIPGNPISHVGFTWNEEKVWFDLSNLDGQPFLADGMELLPSEGQSTLFPTCTSSGCGAGDTECQDVYVNGGIGDVGRSCDQSTSLLFVACSG